MNKIVVSKRENRHENGRVIRGIRVSGDRLPDGWRVVSKVYKVVTKYGVRWHDYHWIEDTKGKEVCFSTSLHDSSPYYRLRDLIGELAFMKLEIHVDIIGEQLFLRAADVLAPTHMTLGEEEDR